jgi:ribonuclease D
MNALGSDLRLVTDGVELEALCDELGEEPVYGFDTEFHTERTYYPHLALIQLAWRDQVALVDPLAVDPAPLGRILAGPGLAVAHASEQDLDVLESACGAVPSAIFDTQVAAGFIGMSSPSLARLLEEMLGVSLPKADRLSDWLARPMSGPQLTYASNDVAHLLALRDALTSRLSELGRLEWAIDECGELLTGRRLGRVPEEAWWKMGDVRRMSDRQRGVAQEVAGWRERRAAATNRPRRTVLSDLALLAISQKPPASRDELTRLRGVDGRHLAQGAGQEILEAIQRGRHLSKAQLHMPPDGRESIAPPAAVAVCGGLVRQIADNLHFDQGLLATRADIALLLCGEPNRLDHGWRSSIAGDPLRQLIGGGVSAAFDRQGHLVLEERTHRPLPMPGDNAPTTTPYG